MYKKLLIIILALIAKPLFAQTVLDVQKIRIFPSAVTQTEPVIAVDPLNPQILFASAVTLNISNGRKSEGVYVSTDGGLTWSGADTCGGQYYLNHGGDPGIAVTGSGRFILSHIGDFYPGVYAHYSTNLGLVWSDAFVVTNIQTGDKGTMTIDNSNQSGYKGRIYLAWTYVVSSFAAANAYSTDDGETWSAPQIVNPNPPLRCVGGSVATSGNGNVFSCWSGITDTLPFHEDYAGLAISTDGGGSWTAQQNIFDMNGIAGKLPSKGNIKVNGLPQVAADNSGGIRDGWIYIVTTEFDIAPAGSDPDILLHRSTDGGQTWSPGIRVNQDPLNNGKIQYFPSLEIDNDGGLNILFYDDRNTTSDSADVFLARSTDGGGTWGEFSIKNSRFNPKPVVGGSGYQGDHIALLAVGDKLYALWMADYSGIYQVWLAIIDRNALSVEDGNDAPVYNFSLSQNYPNPFNSSTRIKYNIEKEGFVQLKVYDMLGNEIITLVSEEKPAGTYEVEFNSVGTSRDLSLPSGVYFYRLTSNGFSDTKKFVLLK
jgi:hypothetical protein